VKKIFLMLFASAFLMFTVNNIALAKKFKNLTQKQQKKVLTKYAKKNKNITIKFGKKPKLTISNKMSEEECEDAVKTIRGRFCTGGKPKWLCDIDCSGHSDDDDSGDSGDSGGDSEDEPDNPDTPIPESEGDGGNSFR